MMDSYENISFPDAIKVTESLLEKMSQMEPAQVEEVVAGLVKTENGARGFFVTYLPSEGIMADNPSPQLLEALKSSEPVVGELLVKNVAMSAGMALTHQRNGDEAMAASSQRVTERSIQLLKLLDFASTKTMAKALGETAKSGKGEWESFLQRWGYDSEQLQAIEQALSKVVE